MNDRPAIFFYTGDLWKDIAFKLCSWQAQNLWLRLLILLHDNIPRGEFRSPSGTPYTDEQIAALCNMPIADFRILIGELESNNVCTRIAGAIANRRMLRETQLHDNKVKAGKKGSTSRWQNDSKTIADGGGKTIATSPTYSSSSSSSSSSSDKDKDSDLREKDKEIKILAEASESRSATPRKAREKVEPKSAATWEAYAQAYQQRWQVQPVRNQTVNGMLCKLVEKLGSEAAPQVAAFYLTHNNPFYVTKRHPVNLLLADAEGLHTQWSTGVKATTSEARNAETRDNVVGQADRVIANMTRRTGL